MFNGDRPRRRWHVCALNIRASAAKRLRRGLAVARVNLTTGGGGKHGSLTRSILLRRERSEGGFTFVELLVVCTIMLILAAAVMPLARVTVQRQREAELRRALREMRTAIDKFKDAADAGMIAPQDLRAGAENYPPDLNTLIEGVSINNDATGRKLKFLRRVPMDPITHSTEWGLRAYQDKPDSTSWAGGNIFDVYTKSDGKALDGTKYKDW
ncbi:MAG: general secretion pathway protein GspG [Acidobacteria bacterium]|nr:MAG: general secretion pathway protein GspG [Acidobacteriota bacterium]